MTLTLANLMCSLLSFANSSSDQRRRRDNSRDHQPESIVGGDSGPIGESAEKVTLSVLNGRLIVMETFMQRAHESMDTRFGNLEVRKNS